VQQFLFNYGYKCSFQRCVIGIQYYQPVMTKQLINQILHRSRYRAVFQVSFGDHFNQRFAVSSLWPKQFEELMKHCCQPTCVHPPHRSGLAISVPYIFLASKSESAKLFYIIILAAHIVYRHKVFFRVQCIQLLCQLYCMQYFINEVQIARKQVWLVCCAYGKCIFIRQPADIVLCLVAFLKGAVL